MRLIRVVVFCLWPSIVAAQPVQVVHRFEVPPHAAIGGLVEAADGNLYGTTSKGGLGGGTIYRVPAGGGAPVTVHRFTRGRVPEVSMIRGIGGVLYGTTKYGGEGAGTVFRFDPATSGLTTLHVFAGTEGQDPVGPVMQAANGILYGTLGYPAGGRIYALDPVTGSIRFLHTFEADGPDGAVPSGGLVEASNGFLYGVMQQVGQTLTGTIYKIARATGAVTRVHNFNTSAGGGRPVALTRTSDGILYATTREGALIVRLDPATDTVTTAATLATGGDGFASRLVEAADGSLYVTTVLGQILRLQRLPGGGHVLSTIHTSDLTAEGFPRAADLALASDGWMYGTTSGNGPSGGGTLYRFDTLQRGGGDPFQFQVTHAFSSRASGWRPVGPPVSWSDGALYGLTEAGGANGAGVVYRLDPVTDAFSIVGSVEVSQSASGTATQHSDLIDGGDGSLYALVGMNSNTARRLIRVTPATNTITVLYEFPVQSGIVRVQPVLARGPGGLYGIRTGLSSLLVFRFDLAAAPVTTPTVAEIQSLFPDGIDGAGLTATSDGKLFMQGYKRIPVDPGGPSTISRVIEVTTATGAARVLASAPDALAVAPAVGLDGRIYFASHNRFGFGPQLAAVNQATLAVQTLCAPQVYGTIVGVEMMPEGTVLVTVDETGAGSSVWACGSATTTAVRRGVITASPTGDRVSRLAFAPGVIVYGTNAAPSIADGPEIVFRLPTTLQPIDRDTDNLSDDWEETYGLNAASGAGADGPGGDPDGDGVTNADEQAAGTHPRGLFTRYLAEGTNNAFFKTRVALLNDALVPAHVLLRFETDANAVFPYVVEVPPATRRTIDVSTIPGPDVASFSTVVESDVRIGVERTMSWDATGYGSHTETAVEAPSTTWFFAEGSTSDQFALFYLLQNPQATAVTATVRYLLPFGQAPVERQYTLPAHSRTTIPVDADAALASTDVSGVVTATAPIIAERAMYLSKPGRPFDAGHDSAGVTAPALEWFLAEGATGPFFDLFLLIANPNPSPAAVTVDYLLQGGGTVTKSYTVPANARFTVWVDDEQIPAGSGQKPLANAAVSMAVRSTNNVPVIVERTMWWPGPETTADFWYEAHNSPGSTTTALKWSAADGEVGGLDGAETYVLIANPTATPGRALVRVFFEDGNTSGRYYDLPAHSRTSVAIGAAFAEEAANRRLGAVVESLGPGAVPIVVEHAIYASPGGVTWTRGSNALAAPLLP